MNTTEKVKRLLESDAAEIRQAGPMGGMELLRKMGGWRKIITAYWREISGTVPPADTVADLRRWAQTRVADHRNQVMV